MARRSSYEAEESAKRFGSDRCSGRSPLARIAVMQRRRTRGPPSRFIGFPPRGSEGRARGLAAGPVQRAGRLVEDVAVALAQGHALPELARRRLGQRLGVRLGVLGVDLDQVELVLGVGLVAR